GLFFVWRGAAGLVARRVALAAARGLAKLCGIGRRSVRLLRMAVRRPDARPAKRDDRRMLAGNAAVSRLAAPVDRARLDAPIATRPGRARDRSSRPIFGAAGDRRSGRLLAPQDVRRDDAAPDADRPG